ncbi:hypothetical protein F2Q68_00011296 [Brassica cretica]|uniref:Uncharacterized protein n=1 Tax=Brassica cretica TaxID=69181 RepID=A0A8S9KZ22_BRACR|nr:hypothetical protein F2Q68_00011296 [Brassica cretica]
MKINQPRRDETQELIVVALGPLANISLTVQLEPEFSKKCQTDCSSWWTIHSKRKELLQANFFSPGEHVVQQLDLMTDMLETQICGSHWKEQESSKKKKPIHFSHKFPHADPLALHLLENMFSLKPKDLPTAEKERHTFLLYIRCDPSGLYSKAIFTPMELKLQALFS